jgi:serine/threonine protein phosphatase PrpC
MEDYHVAEYRKEKNHELGLFAIFDGHLGNRVPSYLKDHLFNNILDEVHPSFPPSVPCLLLLPTLSLLSFSL